MPVYRMMFTDIFVPELVDLVVVSQAALHRVDAEAGARLDGRKTLARRAGGHPLHSIETLGRGRNLEIVTILGNDLC